MNSRFPKQERLCGKKDIASLLKGGKRVYSGDLVLLIQSPVSQRTPGIRILIITPKKIFPRAHQRNRIKRLMREVWRTSKSLLVGDMVPHDFTMHLGFLAKYKTMPDMETIRKEVLQGFVLLKQKGLLKCTTPKKIRQPTPKPINIGSDSIAPALPNENRDFPAGQ